MTQQTTQSDFQANSEYQPDSSSERSPIEEKQSWFKNKKLITIILILIGVIIAGIVVAGYYYKDKIFKQKIEKGLTQEINQIQERQTKKEREKSIKEELIRSNYDQLVLTEKDVQEKFWFMSLDEENSGEIDNMTEISFGNLIPFFEHLNINVLDNEMDILGGYQAYFSVDKNKISKEIDSRYLVEYELDNKIVLFSTVENAQRYVENVKSGCRTGLMEMGLGLPGFTEEQIERYITNIHIGDGGFKCEVFFPLLVFRVKNAVNITSLASELEDLENIIYFAQTQANKYSIGR